MEDNAGVPREKLREIVEKYGEGVLNDYDRVEGLLRDHCGSYRKEISALVGALQERVPLELKSSWQMAMTPEAMRARLVQRLEDNRGLAPAVADWSVEAWSYALGVNLGRRSDRLDSVVLGDAGLGAAGVAAGTLPPQGFDAPRTGSDRVMTNLERVQSDRAGGYVAPLVTPAQDPALLAAAEQKKKAGFGIGLLVLILAISAFAYHHHQEQQAVVVPPQNPPVQPKTNPTPTPTPVTPPPEPTPVAVPVSTGTLVNIRLNQGINSDETEAGQTFTGTVVSPLRVNGNTVVPQGADALIEVASLDRAGKLTGRSTLQLELTQVTVGKKHYPVKSAVKMVQGPAQVAEAGKRAGIGGAVGAAGGFIVGKVFHHGAAGAGAGAAAGGAAGVVTTKPQPAKLKPESVVVFKLTAPLSVP